MTVFIPDIVVNPQAIQTCGLCALGLVQVKAAGLVQAFDLPPAFWAFGLFPGHPKDKAFFGCLVI